jgi:hypothetical protein
MGKKLSVFNNIYSVMAKYSNSGALILALAERIA